MRKTTLFLFILVSFFQVNAQNLKDTISNKVITIFHYGPSDEFINKLSDHFHIKVKYDTAFLHKTILDIDFASVKLPDVLKEFCKKTDSKFLINSKNIVYIFKKYQKIDIDAVDFVPELVVKKVYEGPPSKTNFTITGRTVDKKTGETLPYVTLNVVNTKIQTISNIDGLFTLNNVPSDTAKISANYVGYNTFNIFLTPTTITQNLKFELDQPSTFDDEVVVVAKIPNILKANEKVGMYKMTPSKLAVLPNVGEKDILRSFQLMPGISAANENSAGLYVRGGTPDQSLVLYDGFTVYNVDHLFGFFSAFNSNAIKDVQLYKGSFDSKYGGRMSSVAEFTGKEGSSKKLNFGVDISLMSVNAFFESPLSKKSTFFIAARKSFKGPLYDKIFKQYSAEQPVTGSGFSGGRRGNRFAASNTSQIASYFYDLNAKYTYRPSTKDVISLSFFNGTDDLDNSTKINPPSFLSNTGIKLSFDNSDITNWGNTGTSAKWSRKWNSNLYSNTLISFSNYYSDRNLSSAGSIVRNDSTITFNNGTFENNRLKDYSAKIDFEYKLSGMSQLEFGTQINHFDVSYKYAQNDTSYIINRQTQGNLSAAYLQHKFNYNDIFKMTLGGRANYFQPTQQFYFEPRVNAQLNLSKEFSLKAAGGRYYQFIKRVVREDIQQGSRDFWILTDGVKLPIAYNDQMSVGASFENKNYLFDVEAYDKKLMGLSEYSLRIARSFTIPGQSSLVPVENFLQGTGKARGIDFLIQKKSGKINGWIAYTLGEVLNNYPAYKDGDFYASNDVTHELKIVGIYKWRSWDFSMTWIYATGKPYTSIDGGYSQNLPDGSTRTFYIVSDKNANRLADYHRMDVAANYNLKFADHSTATISFSIFNLYDRKNDWYKQFATQSDYIVETTKNYLGITPNITFSYKFL
jgi:hypothetical protein